MFEAYALDTDYYYYPDFTEAVAYAVKLGQAEHENINILCPGARVAGVELAKDLVAAFLNVSFAGDERHRRRLDIVVVFARRARQGSGAKASEEE